MRCKWSLVRPFWRKGKVMNTSIWIIFCTSYDSCFYVLAFNEMSCWKVWNKVLLHLYNFDNTIYIASLFLGNINTFLEIFLLEKQQQQQQKNKSSPLTVLCDTIPFLQDLVKCKKLKSVSVLSQPLPRFSASFATATLNTLRGPIFGYV